MQEQNQSSTSTMPPKKKKKKATNFLHKWNKIQENKTSTSTIRRCDCGMWDKYPASSTKEEYKTRDKNVRSPS